MANLFEDSSFPAAPESMFYDGRTVPGVEWKRPTEICTNPVFISDGATKHDIAQGHLSDCWFLSAAAVLATDNNRFSEIIPPGQDFGDNYTGRFRFRFWRYGNWEEVEVDDRLPTKNGELYFCHNRDTAEEFWSALLEKAYAKVHGSYQALNYGYSHDALVDMTGGLGEFINMGGSIGVRVAETEDAKAANITRLFRRLKRLVRKNCTFLCAAIDVAEGGAFEDTLDNGLVTGHAYSICNIIELTLQGVEHRLIKLRNPWGWKEWSGPWSDSSSEWQGVSEAEKQELNLTMQNEGEFWMSFEAWVENFDALNLCHLTPDSVHAIYGESVWETATYHGIWAAGASAGGCSANQATYWQNPQYYVRLADPDEDADDECTLVVSLMQKYARERQTTERREDTDAAIGFDLFKYRGSQPEELEGFQSGQGALQIRYPMYDYEFFRERSRRFSLSPGTYCIIPSTFTPGVEAQFLIRLAFEKPADSGEVDTPSGVAGSRGAAQGQRFEQLFDSLAGQDGVVDARELKRILNQGIKRQQDEEFSKETSRALIRSILIDKNLSYTKGSHRGTIDRATTRGLWDTVRDLQSTFDEFDQDGSGAMDIRELRRGLRAAGYTLSRRTLSTVAQQYCGKTDQITLDDFVLLATKISTTSGSFEEARRRTGSGAKVELTVDEVLQMAL